MRLKTLGLRRETLKSQSRKSSISVITVEQLDILDQIATSGKPLKRAIAWSHRETKICFHPLLLLSKIFSKPSCSFQTWMVLTTPSHYQIKGSLNEKVLPRCGRKKAPSDFVTFFSLFSSCLCFALLVCFALLFWVYLVLCIDLFNLFLFVFLSVLVYFVFHIKINK